MRGLAYYYVGYTYMYTGSHQFPHPYDYTMPNPTTYTHTNKANTICFQSKPRQSGHIPYLGTDAHTIRYSKQSTKAKTVYKIW